MPSLLRRCLLSACPIFVLSISGSVFAGGGPTTPLNGQQEVIGHSSYRCKGGIRVEVTQMTDTARVEFAGRSQVLRLTPEGNGVAYQNRDFAWFSQGRLSYMKNTHSGDLALTDCSALNN